LGISSVFDRESLLPFEGYLKDDRILFRDSEKSIPQLKYFLHEVESIVSTSVIRQYADGEPKLEAIVGRKGLIDNPKPPGLIEKFVRANHQRASTDSRFLRWIRDNSTSGD